MSVRVDEGCEWNRLTLTELSRVAMAIRRIAGSSPSLICRATSVAQRLFETFLCHENSSPVCPLIQVFQTVKLQRVNDEVFSSLQQRTAVSGEALPSTVLQLIGSYGVEDEWCDPLLSLTYRCVPVNDTSFPLQFPMLSALVGTVSAPSQHGFSTNVPGVSMPCHGTPKCLHMLYVPDLRSSAYLSTQEPFVASYDIRSVIGFGEEFHEREGFFVVMYSREEIPRLLLPFMRMLALNIRLGLEWPGQSERGRERGRVTNAGTCHRSAESSSTDNSGGNPYDDVLGLYEHTLIEQEMRLQNDAKHVADQQRLIEDQAARLQAVNHQLLFAAEEERRKLSRTLHDVVGTQLGGLIFQMQAVLDVPDEREGLLRWIATYRQELLEIVNLTRGLSFELHPSSLERVGLVGALERVLHDAGRRQNWLVKGHCLQGVESALTDEQAVCVYRIAQEAIHNAEKHAKASCVILVLDQCGEDLVLRVCDDGQGFKTLEGSRVAQSRGLGHVAMEERARLINASLTIVSSPGSGTTVSLRMTRGGSHYEGVACR